MRAKTTNQPPFQPPTSSVRMGRPPIKEGKRLQYIMSVRFRKGEIEYLETFRATIQRDREKLTVIIRDLLDRGLEVLDESDISAQCALTAARGKRHVFRITYEMNRVLEDMALRFSEDIRRRVYKIDVVARAVLIMAHRLMDNMGVDAGNPLGVKELRTYTAADEARSAKAERDRKAALTESEATG